MFPRNVKIGKIAKFSDYGFSCVSVKFGTIVDFMVLGLVLVSGYGVS